MPQNQTLPQVWLCACVHVSFVCLFHNRPCMYIYVCVCASVCVSSYVPIPAPLPVCVCVTCATHPLLPSPLAVAGLPFNAQPKKGVKFNSKEDSSNTEKLAQVQTYSTYQCYCVAMVMLPWGALPWGALPWGALPWGALPC